MKRAYKIIEHREVSESARRKRGIALVERTTEAGYGKKPKVDIIEVHYPIWDDYHMTANVCLDDGSPLGVETARVIADEIDRLVSPEKE